MSISSHAIIMESPLNTSHIYVYRRAPPRYLSHRVKYIKRFTIQSCKGIIGKTDHSCMATVYGGRGIKREIG